MVPHSVDSSWQAARSKENLDAGKLLLKEQKYNAAASRLYYALYHAAWFILAKANEDPRKLPSRRETEEPLDSWPHKHLLGNAVLIVMKMGYDRMLWMSA